MKPRLPYTIWFSQQTGSTLLCKALESTGIAGKPNNGSIANPIFWMDSIWQIMLSRKNIYGILVAHQMESLG